MNPGYRTLLVIACAVFFVLLAPSANAQTCFGCNCGPTVLSCCTQNPTNHCRQNAAGEECWDAQAGAGQCQQLGYDRACTFACSGGGLHGGGGGATLAASAFGGVDIFGTTIRRSVVPRLEADQMTNPLGGEPVRGSSSLFNEVTTSIDSDSWEVAGADGDTKGAHFGWYRHAANGRLLGANVSYQEAEPDAGGQSTELLAGNFTIGHTIGDAQLWKWSANVVYRDISGVGDDTLIGGGGQIHFNKFWENGHVLSGGVQGTYLSSDNLLDDPISASVGVAYGFPIAQRFGVDLEVYGVNLVEPDVTDDTFYTLGGRFSAFITRRLTLILGYRLLEGIDGVDSNTITLGASTRWE